MAIKISVGVIIVTSIMCALFCVSKKKYSNSTLLFILFLYLIPLCVISYNIIPGKTTDLYEHFYIINLMKIYGFNINYANGIYFIKYLFFMISKIGNNNILPLVSTLISYSSFFYIFYNIYKKKEINCLYVFYILMCFFSLSSFYYIFTGIKSSIAFAFFALSIYLSEKNRKIWSLMFMILSVFSHGIIIFLVFLYIISKIDKLKKYIFFFPLIIGGVNNVLLTIDIPFINYISNKILIYTTSDEIPSSNLIFMIDMIYGGLLLIRTTILIKNAKEREQVKELNIVQCILIFFVTGVIFNKLLIERGIMLISYFQYRILLYEREKKIRYLYYIIDSMFCILKIAYFFIRLIHHVSFM